MPIVQDAIEEVVNGEIRIMPPNKEPRVFTVEELADIIRPQIDRKKIKLLITNFGLVIRRHPLTSRVPDLILYTIQSASWIDGYLHSPRNSPWKFSPPPKPAGSDWTSSPITPPSASRRFGSSPPKPKQLRFSTSWTPSSSPSKS